VLTLPFEEHRVWQVSGCWWLSDDVGALGEPISMTESSMADIPASSSLGAHGARPPTVLVVDDDEGVSNESKGSRRALMSS